MSSLWRISVSYSRQSTVGPKTLIIKLPSCDAKTREIAKSGGFYEREVRFYKEFPPHRDVPAPVLYHAEIDPGSGNSVIVLEDLGGLTHGDQETEPSLWPGEEGTPLFSQDACLVVGEPRNWPTPIGC